MSSLLPVILSLVFSSLIHGGEFRLAPFYSDNMVVQRDKPVVLIRVIDEV